MHASDSNTLPCPALLALRVSLPSVQLPKTRSLFARPEAAAGAKRPGLPEGGDGWR